MPTNANLFAAIEAVARTQPQAAFLVTAEGETLTYGALEPRVGRFAQALAGAGVAPGDRVAVQVEKSPESLLLYFACLKAGAVHLPLNTAYTDDELGYFFGDAEPRLVVCDPARRPGIEHLAPAAIHTLDRHGRGSLADAAEAAGEGLVTVERAPGDLAAICYTSGTTGRPKGAMLTHANLLSNARTLRTAWGFTAEDVLLHALPLYHVHGLFVATHTAALAGATLLFLERFEAEIARRLLPRATVMMGVPTYYSRLLAEPSALAEAAAGMRLFVSGSAPLREETFEAFAEATGHRILERYGMTETGMNCSNPLHGPRKPGSVGPPLPGVSVRVRGEAGHLLEPEGIGELEVAGPNVFPGYWRMPEKTAEAFTADGWFRTGDLALIGTDGYVRIVGRGKDLIITGGLNVYPKEVENVLDRLEGVGESAVFGIPHPDFGEAVVAAVTPAADDPPEEAAILAQARGRLAGFKLPKRVLVVPSLPRNSMGKIEKGRLREAHAGLFSG